MKNNLDLDKDSCNKIRKKEEILIDEIDTKKVGRKRENLDDT